MRDLYKKELEILRCAATAPNGEFAWTMRGTDADSDAERLRSWGLIKCRALSATGRFWTITDEGREALEKGDAECKA